MSKTILITGSTDGIGLQTAKLLVAAGHEVLLHGRSAEKLEAARQTVAAQPDAGRVACIQADLSSLDQVVALADTVMARQVSLDVLINNAGVFKIADPVTPDGLDARFAVNAIAPYLLTRLLLPLLGKTGRIVNVSSAAQATVDMDALVGGTRLADMDAYAQSKLALTMWSRALAETLPDGPSIFAVNPGSLLGSKMVREGFGVAGGDLRIGADILARAALSDDFAGHSGQYFDNDVGSFAAPHPNATDGGECDAIVRVIEECLRSRRH